MRKSRSRRHLVKKTRKHRSNKKTRKHRSNKKTGGEGHGLLWRLLSPQKRLKYAKDKEHLHRNKYYTNGDESHRKKAAKWEKRANELEAELKKKAELEAK